ncbi:conserved Plasmodium protein, unknown function [Plasmodium gallinaceum]|uniref:Uncharacterized protein n=1 Tax=Plasmodium gallinaceum TaxID=5849 RepID=A0A1J1GUL5_PLAGA|nr:conserved Plasmodium protein, unknown function [Plasmodium gallinaceum]CRG95000.1 conserved Plasmodium protein, unknown function [Plasmodium gallinaceum]
MICCSKSIIHSVDTRKRNDLGAIEKKEKSEKKDIRLDDGNELITIYDNKVSLVNIVKKASENALKLQEEKKDLIKKPFTSKSNILKYYENKFLKKKNNENTIYLNRKKEHEKKKETEKLSKNEDEDKNKENLTNELQEVKDFSKLKTKSKYNILNEVEKKLKQLIKDEKINIHNDILFLNIYALTHKKIYSILDKKKKNKGYYSCNEILEMILKGKLNKNSLIKRKSDVHYYQLKQKISEIYFLKQLELQYYLKIKRNEHSLESKELKKYINQENITFLELSETLLAEKVKSLKNFLIAPYDKNIVEIILIPKQKNCDNFYGYHKIISNLFITKYISVFFYHVIEKKVENYNLKKKNGPIYIKMKLKTDYPEAIQTIFRYIYYKNINLYNLDFKLLVTMYMECINLKIISIINDIIDAINEKANFENIVKVLHFSSVYKETNIFKDFTRIISDSGFYLFSGKYHYLLDTELYIYILSLDNIMINEIRIFIESIKYIIKNNCDAKQQNLIFQNIRFNVLNNEYLYSIQQYIKNCFEEILENKCNSSNFIYVGYHSQNDKRIMVNSKTNSEDSYVDIQDKDQLHDKNEIINNNTSNLPISEEIKTINELYKSINKESFEPPNFTKEKKEISNKKFIECMNNVYNILFDNIFKKILNKEIKKRCDPWKENKEFNCVNNFTNQKYSFYLQKKKNKMEKYAFTYGDERLISECKLFFQIIQTKNSNVSIGIILRTNELNFLNEKHSKIPSFLIQYHEHLVIYFDFFVNDFYVCNIDNDNLTLINKTKLNIYSDENKITNEDTINYEISVINEALHFHIIILPKNISFTSSFAFLKPIFVGDIIKKPFIHIKPFFILKDSLDSIAIPAMKI